MEPAFGKTLADVGSYESRRQQPKESFGHHDSFHGPLELDLGLPAAESRRALQPLSPASVDQGLSSAASYASPNDGSKRAGDARSSRSGTELRGNQDEQRTGTEISSAALGQNSQTAGAPFYTGMSLCCSLIRCLYLCLK